MEELEQQPETAKKRLRLAPVVGAAAVLAVGAGILLYSQSNVYRTLTAELGEPIPEASAFLKRGAAAEYLGLPEIDPRHEGDYLLTLKTPGGTRRVTLLVRDTTPPAAENADVHLLPGRSLRPEEALRDLTDASETSAAWESAPRLDSPGAHPCSVRLEDAYGNVSVIPATVTVAEILENVAYTIGDARPAASAFVRDWNGAAEFVTDPDSLDWSRPGTAAVELAVGGERFSSSVSMLDGSPPELKLIPSAAVVGAEVAPEDFVLRCTDVSPVGFSFETQPSTAEAGTYSVSVTATDAAGNTVTETTELYVAEAVAELEASRDAIPAWRLAPLFGTGLAGYSMDIATPFTPDTPGAVPVTLSSWKGEVPAAIRVRDTAPPAAESAEAPVCYLGYTRPPEYFASGISDATEVTGRFAAEPDWDTPGTREVTVILTDTSGNERTVTAEASFVPDEEAPRIYAARDRYCYVGEAVAYFREVFAEDNIDPDVLLEVDKSQVNYRAAGAYPVTYTATDRDGNVTSVDVTYTFVEQTVSDAELDALADEILAEILTDDMSVAEKARAIYNYVYSGINYIGSSDKTNWKGEAYRGLTTHFGDCFTYYSSAYLLLSKVDGIELLSVERMGGWTRHYWLLVNLGTGWYHFDACRGSPENVRAFMKTTWQLYSLEQGSYYWRFDESLYPEVAATVFQMF